MVNRSCSRSARSAYSDRWAFRSESDAEALREGVVAVTAPVGTAAADVDAAPVHLRHSLDGFPCAGRKTATASSSARVTKVRSPVRSAGPPY